MSKRFLHYWKPSLAIFIDSEIWPNITETKAPLPDHEKFKDEENKFDKYFEENI